MTLRESVSTSGTCSAGSMTHHSRNHDGDGPPRPPVWKQPATGKACQGPLLGNGDLGLVAFGEDSLVFSVGKNDVWDRRLFTCNQKPLTFQEYIYNKVPGVGTDLTPPRPDWSSEPPPNHRNYMQPKPVCAVEMVSGRVEGHELDLETARLTTVTEKARLSAHVQKDRNIAVLDIDPRHPVQFSLWRADDTAGTGIQSARHFFEKGVCLIVQDFPAEKTFPDGFRVVVAARLEGGGQIKGDDSRFTAEVSGPARLILAVVTTRDAGPDGDPVEQACRLLENFKPDEGILLHRELWRTFWDRSWLRLNDPLMQDLWHLNNYFLACSSRPGAVAPGLFSPWITRDTSMWNNAYTADYNFQQPYAGALSCNHPELLEAYIETVETLLPAAREWAGEIFGAEGIAFAHEMFPIDMRGQMRGNRAYIVETPFVVQPFWEYYLHTCDLDFLKKRGYPLIAGAADFMASFATETRPGRFELLPTRSCEHHGYDPDLCFHRNGSPDIAFAKYILEAALEAADLVGEASSERRLRWKRVLSGLPDYARFRLSSGEVLLDAEASDPDANFLPPIDESYLSGCADLQYSSEMRPSKQAMNHGAWMIYNLPTSLWPVWPAGQIDADSPPDELLAAIRTWNFVRMEGSNDLLQRYMVASRLGLVSFEEFKFRCRDFLEPNGTLSLLMQDRLRAMPESVRRICEDFGVYTENFGFPAVLNEMMLQSHRGVIRLFPAWDPYLKAEFHGFLARGGFVVSAACDYGYVRRAEIAATVKSVCRVRLFGPSRLIALKEAGSGRSLSFDVVDNNMVFDLEAGQTVLLQPKRPRFANKSEGLFPDHTLG